MSSSSSSDIDKSRFTPAWAIVNKLTTHAFTAEQAEAAINAEITKAEIRGMERAKSRVLRRTEIPADAKNPTRDEVVMLGEAIAAIIQLDIVELKKDMEG